jgi:hypothetical protein
LAHPHSNIANLAQHTSLSAPSLCTAKHVRAYFQDGTVPTNGTVCEADIAPFQATSRIFENIESEDQELRAALLKLALSKVAVPNFGL